MASSDDEQLIKNYSLFISVRENRPLQEKLENIRRCLEQGADVNASDGNDGFNSPLHVAVRRGDTSVARLLLHHGADVTLKNWSGNTSLSIAQALHTQDKRDIVNLLQNANSKKSVNVALPIDRSQTSCDIDQSNSKTYLKNNAQFKFSKRDGTSGICGQLYETKLLTLVLMRAEDDKEIEEFYLGSNIRGIGDMDDICLRYRVRGRQKPVALFLQTKHREDCEKGRFTVEGVKSVSGDFSLRKYFESYLTIRDRFRADNKDPMFEGDFDSIECNFVLYTPVKEYFTKKKMERNVSEKMHYLISTAQNKEAFQYDYDGYDIHFLTKMTIMDQLKKLGTVLLELIMSDKDKTDMMLMNKLIAKYHVVLGREVLRQCRSKEQANKEYCTWEFRPEFFKSDCEYLVALKRALVKELSTKRCDHSKITNENREKFKLLLQDPCASTISTIIGKLVIYNDKSKKLQLTDVTVFTDEFKMLLERFDGFEIIESVISEAVTIKLESMKIKLRPEFGNIDMTFRGSEAKVKRRMKVISDRLMQLFQINKETKVVEINDDVVGPGKPIEQGIIFNKGGIGSAVGNLLVLDMDTNMLKFDLDNEELPHNAALLLNELKNKRYSPINEELSGYRLNVDINGFPKYSFHEEEINIGKQVKEFFSKLWFYTNQAKEDEVELILKDHINKKQYGTQNAHQFQFKLHSDTIFLRTHDEMQNWWKKTGESSYFSRSSNFFERAKLADIDYFLINVKHTSEAYIFVFIFIFIFIHKMLFYIS